MALKRDTDTQPLHEVQLQRVGGRASCAEALDASLRGTAGSADLGGSSNYSNENFED
jgi:hypothetical protein